MERAGVPRSVATNLSGHKTESVYRRYAIAYHAAMHHDNFCPAGQTGTGDGCDCEPETYYVSHGTRIEDVIPPPPWASHGTIAAQNEDTGP